MINTEFEWAEGVLTINFDLEEGQIVDYVYPEGILSKEILKNLAYFAFPDSYVFSPEGELYYAFSIEDK